MSFTNDPSNILDRIRLTVGDTEPMNEYLSDEWYTYFLTKNNNNETLSSIDAAKAILVKFTGNTREREGQIEVYGNEQFDQYLAWLKSFIEDPSISGLRSPVPYAGGISKSDMESNRCNSDVNSTPIHTGFIEETSSYNGYYRR